MPALATLFRIGLVVLAVEGAYALAHSALKLPPWPFGPAPTWHWVLLHAVASALISGLLIYFWVIRPYIGAQRRAMSALEDVTETISEGFLMFDAEDRLTICNRKFRELYDVASDLFVVGRTFEEILRAGVDRGQYPEAEGRVEAWVTERLQTHRNPGGAIERQLPNGRWVKITEARTGSGGTVGIRTDITEIKQREHLLQASEERLRQIVDTLQEGFVLYGPDDRLVMWNEKWLKIHKDTADAVGVGSTFEELLRISVSRKLFPEAFGREEEFIAERIAHHRNPGQEMIRQHHDGHWYVIREARTAEGGIFAISIDITDLKRAETKANEARLQAERADKSKSEFLANMSHEFRTPLNAIIGFSEVMEHETFGPIGSVKYRSYAQDIKQSGQHLLGLVSDILDLAKVESGKDELHEADIDVAPLVDAAIMLVRQNADSKRISLAVDIADETTGLRADERKVTQILINLLTNAIKFTEADGRVTLRAYCDSNFGYVFEVSDDGIGIAPENIPKALSQFSQVENPLNKQLDGTGLGLPLSKALVELHGGSLTILSELEIGTTVRARFPADRILPRPGRKACSPAA